MYDYTILLMKNDQMFDYKISNFLAFINIKTKHKVSNLFFINHFNFRIYE